MSLLTGAQFALLPLAAVLLWRLARRDRRTISNRDLLRSLPPCPRSRKAY